MIKFPMKITVIAPHPDDEVLGAGGTIARFSDEGIEVSVLIVSGHLPPLYPPEIFEITRRESEKSLKILGVSRWEFLKIPATKVHQVPVAELNGMINRFVRDSNPEVVLLPLVARLTTSVLDRTMLSLPMPAKKRSTPPPPIKVLAPALPMMASLAAVPVTLVLPLTTLGM